jgi:hypothetical protein
MIESTKMKTFNDYTAFGALDVVLKVIYEVDTGMWGLTKEEIFTGLINKEDTQFAHQEIETVLKQLIKDENVEKTTRNGYIVSFAGRYLHQQGGYRQQDRISQSQITLARNSYIVTASVAFSTFVSAVYYFFQLYDGMPQPHPVFALLLIPTCLLWIAILEGKRYLKSRK